MYPPLDGIEKKFGPTKVHLQVYDGPSAVLSFPPKFESNDMILQTPHMFYLFSFLLPLRENSVIARLRPFVGRSRA